MLLCTHVFVSSFCQWLSLAHPDHRLYTYSICHCISGHGLAFEACFKLPATFTWTQAAKASLGRQRHSYSPGPWGTNEQSCFFFFLSPGGRGPYVNPAQIIHARKTLKSYVTVPLQSLYSDAVCFYTCTHSSIFLFFFYLTVLFALCVSELSQVTHYGANTEIDEERLSELPLAESTQRGWVCKGWLAFPNDFLLNVFVI